MGVLGEEIRGDQARNVRHDAIKVARHASPLPSELAKEQFLELLQAADTHDYRPDDYGLHSPEWDEDAYPEEEPIRVGTRGKSMDIPLPSAIWFPRAVKWVQGLDILTRFLDELVLPDEGGGDDENEA